jgi:NADH:ubiquinone oxidoreductase subunit 3 (subunit A)
MTILISFAIGLSFFLILLSYLISHKSNYPVQFGIINDESERKSQYECGLEVFEEDIGLETRERFYLKFYIISILFLIFDLETLLLFPISLIFFDSSLSYTDIVKPFIVFLIFITILLIGLYYEYRKNVL